MLMKNHSRCKHAVAWICVPGRQTFAFAMVGWLAVLGFNATLTAKVISWRSVTHMCFLAFSHQY